MSCLLLLLLFLVLLLFFNFIFFANLFLHAFLFRLSIAFHSSRIIFLFLSTTDVHLYILRVLYIWSHSCHPFLLFALSTEYNERKSRLCGNFIVYMYKYIFFSFFLKIFSLFFYIMYKAHVARALLRLVFTIKQIPGMDANDSLIIYDYVLCQNYLLLQHTSSNR